MSSTSEGSGTTGRYRRSAVSGYSPSSAKTSSKICRARSCSISETDLDVRLPAANAALTRTCPRNGLRLLGIYVMLYGLTQWYPPRAWSCPPCATRPTRTAACSSSPTPPRTSTPDPGPEVHRVLIEKVFPHQADIVQTGDLEALSS